MTYQTLNFEGATTDREKIWPAVFGDERAVRCVAEISAEEFFATHLIPRVPVIVTDAASEWAAHRKWTWEWLAATYGQADVLVVDRRREKQQVRLSEYIDYVLEPARYQINDGPLYLTDLGLHDLPELFQDYAVPHFVDDWFTSFPPESRPPFRWLFIGPASTGSQLHIDTSGTHAWLTQIRGEKEWRLFPPDDLPESYCDAADAFAPDIEQFPAFTRARCYKAVLKAGETIFVPYGWRHQVRNLGPSWSLTENFFNASNVDDVYRHAVHPGIRPILDDICLAKAHQLRGAGRDAVSTKQADLLQHYFINRERELTDRLTVIRKAKEALSTSS